MTTACQLDVRASVENSANEARLDSRGRHTSDHDRGGNPGDEKKEC